MITFLLSVCIALAGFSGLADAAYGSDCTSDGTTACLDADNTVCTVLGDCETGTCSACATGYIASGGACKNDYGQSCTADGDCATGKCTSSACACADTHTWDTTYLACYTTDKGWGATCGTPDVNADCHVDAAGNGACNADTQCDCASGYLKRSGYTCGKPWLGEACDAGVGCMAKGTVSGTSGEVAPTCQSSVCACDSGSSHVSATYDGESYCSPAVPNTLKKTYEACTAHNECVSGKCFSCNNGAGAICLSSTSSGSKINIKSALILTFTVIAGLLRL